MSVRVKVPATTANLGPGFDALGLALHLWNEADFSLREDGQIVLSIQGEGAGSLPTNAGNLVAESALRLFDLAGITCPGLDISCLNRIPLGSGMGSSSAALLTGYLGANALIDHPLSNEELLKLAIETEGHPDNVAPAMLGGLVASFVEDNRVVAKSLPLKPDVFRLSLVLPEVRLSTKEARGILPQTISRGDAVFNLGRVLWVVEALREGDLDGLRSAMRDRLHQPYRLPHIPGAAQALEAAEAFGAAAALSGAGPSLIAFSTEGMEGVGEAMTRAFARVGVPVRVFALEPSFEGANVTSR